MFRNTHACQDMVTWASYKIRKTASCACAGDAGNVFPCRRLQWNRRLAIPACITARGSRTCRDVCRDRLPTGVGETLPAFPTHAHPQFCLSGKRLIAMDRRSTFQEENSRSVFSCDWLVLDRFYPWPSGPFSKKILSYWNSGSHYKPETVVRPS